MSRVTVVAATHNRVARLGSLLDALAAQTVGTDAFDVVVVDDGSTDGTPQLLAERSSGEDLNLRFVRLEPSGGPARARNTGWRMATGELVAFTDDDCRPASTWLEQLLAAAAGRTDVIVQGRTQPDPEEAHLLGPYARTVDIPGPSPYFETCNILYPRDVLERANGFNEEFLAAAGEDADLGFRAVELGTERIFARDAVVYHMVEVVGARGMFKRAGRATHEVPAFRRPEMRDELTMGLFYKSSHPLALQGLLALIMALRFKPALLFALPYLLHMRARTRMVHGSAKDIPFLVAHDAVEITATVRGAVRYRVPIA